MHIMKYKFISLKQLNELTLFAAEPVKKVEQIELFLIECCYIDTQKAIKSSELFAEYKLWCDKMDKYCVSQKEFATLLFKNGSMRVHKSNGNYWIGLALKIAGVTEEMKS